MTTGRVSASRLAALRRRARLLRRWLPPAPASGILADAVPFQDEIGEIIAERPPRFMRATHLVIMMLFLSLLLVAAVIRVDVVVSGNGRLTTSTPPIVVQPLERGIIRQLAVGVGDVVTRGQVLATLDPTFAEAELGTLTVQQQAAAAELRRVEAERRHVPFVPGPAPSADDLLQLQIFQQRQIEYASKLEVYDQQILQLDASIRTIEDDKSALSRQIDIAREMEGMRAELFKMQTGSRIQYLDAQATRLRLEKDYQDSANRLPELNHEMQSRKAERQSFIDNWQRQIVETAATLRTDVGKLDAGIAKAARISDLVTIRAPADGVVLEVARRSVGSVMREAEALFVIVPSEATLVADIMIASRDIGYTQPGNDAVVKVDAFPYQRHGLLDGRLLWISEESAATATAVGLDAEAAPAARTAEPGAWHRGRIALTGTRLQNLPPGAHLLPGMTLTADIKVDRRSLLGFFLAPITRSLGESLREP